jgi:hypothetical protein
VTVEHLGFHGTLVADHGDTAAHVLMETADGKVSGK